MRRSAASTRSRAVATVARVGGDAGQSVEGEDLDVGVAVAPGIVEDRGETRLGVRDPVRGVHGGQQAFAERGLLAAPGVRGATPSPPRAPPGPARACPSARRTRPRWTRASAARRTSPVASALSIASPGWRRRPRSRRPGTAPVRGWTAGRPRSAGSRGVAMSAAARPMWTTASSKRCWMRASSPSIASRRTCSHGSSTIRSQCSTWSTASTLRASSPAEIAARAANSQFAAWSHGRSSPS